MFFWMYGYLGIYSCLLCQHYPEIYWCTCIYENKSSYPNFGANRGANGEMCHFNSYLRIGFVGLSVCLYVRFSLSLCLCLSLSLSLSVCLSLCLSLSSSSSSLISAKSWHWVIHPRLCRTSSTGLHPQQHSTHLFVPVSCIHFVLPLAVLFCPQPFYFAVLFCP